MGLKHNRVYVVRKNVFGRYLIYPVNQNARKLSDLIGKKTFTESDIDKIIGLGFDVAYVVN